MPEIAVQPGEPVLPSLGPDKFLNSDFEKMLKDKGVKTIIINGTAAQSTVLHTGGEAALRGFDVIAPIDRPAVDVPRADVVSDVARDVDARCAPGADTDGDGLSNDVECRDGTDPTRADTDGDGLSDGAESRYGRVCVATDGRGAGSSRGAGLNRGGLSVVRPSMDTSNQRIVD